MLLPSLLLLRRCIPAEWIVGFGWRWQVLAVGPTKVRARIWWSSQAGAYTPRWFITLQTAAAGDIMAP